MGETDDRAWGQAVWRTSRSADEAEVIHVRDGELLVSDGPFAETKEQIGGYDVVECAGLDAAIGIAAGHPLARTAKVEVRPFWDAPWEYCVSVVRGPRLMSNPGADIRRRDDRRKRRVRRNGGRDG